jgi:hypothetical protein
MKRGHAVFRILAVLSSLSLLGGYVWYRTASAVPSDPFASREAVLLMSGSKSIGHAAITVTEGTLTVAPPQSPDLAAPVAEAPPQSRTVFPGSKAPAALFAPSESYPTPGPATIAVPVPQSAPAYQAQGGAYEQQGSAYEQRAYPSQQRASQGQRFEQVPQTRAP